MRNKRRIDTQTKHEGTPTGSATYQATLYPHVFDEDKELSAFLDNLARARKSSGWLREAALFYHSYQQGNHNHAPTPAQNKTLIPENPILRAEDRDTPSKSDMIVSTMGLKLGRTK